VPRDPSNNPLTSRNHRVKSKSESDRYLNVFAQANYKTTTSAGLTNTRVSAIHGEKL